MCIDNPNVPVTVNHQQILASEKSHTSLQALKTFKTFFPHVLKKQRISPFLWTGIETKFVNYLFRSAYMYGTLNRQFIRTGTHPCISCSMRFFCRLFIYLNDAPRLTIYYSITGERQGGGGELKSLSWFTGRSVSISISRFFDLVLRIIISNLRRSFIMMPFRLTVITFNQHVPAFNMLN